MAEGLGVTKLICDGLLDLERMTCNLLGIWIATKQKGIGSLSR